MGDTSAGMGNYPIAIYYKLMDGLKYKIIDVNDRKKHILEKMLYMGELSKKNCFIIKQIFDINDEYKLNLYQGDSLQLNLKKEFGISKFDILIGNPPYNQEFKGNNGYAPSLYDKFIEYYINKCKILSYITPSRWFSGGRGLDKFKRMMLNRKDINYIKHYKNAKDIFGNSVDIEGGINYFLIDNTYNYKSKGHFKIPLTDKRLQEIPNINSIKCYVSKQKKIIKYIDKNNFNQEQLIKFHIITPSANGKKGCFGNIFIGNQNEVYSESYISFHINTYNEASSLLSYMKCRLPNFILSLRKMTQNICSDTCKWIPLPKLDRIWNDNEIYKYFNLTNDDIILINNTDIIGYKNLENIKQLPTQQLPTQQLPTQQLPNQQLPNQETNYNKMTIPQLKEECKKRNIKHPSKINKQPLLEFLLKNL